MSGYLSLSVVLAQINVGHSTHRTARVLRFIHRHPDSHQKDRRVKS